MTDIIALPALSASMDMTYFRTAELSHKTLFAVDRSIRSAFKVNPQAKWREVVCALESNGFSYIERPRNQSIFVYFRSWDEHLISGFQSFLVFFPVSAGYELRNKLIMATPLPMFYTSVMSDYVGDGRVILVNEEHEPIYSDDMVWEDIEQTRKIPLGEMYLIEEQFSCEFEYLKAKEALALSGYLVGNAPGSWNNTTTNQ